MSAPPLTELEEQVCRVLADRQDAMVAELAAHVAIPTATGYASGLNRYRDLLIERLRAIGATITLRRGEPRPAWLDVPTVRTSEGESKQSIPPVVVAVGPRRSRGGKRVLLAGHLDTVHDPESGFDRMTIAADGKTATGPGVVDMKGGILIAVHALEALRELDVEHDWTMVLNSDEERGSFQSLRVLTEVAGEHDVGIALEPALADGSLAIERMGSGQFKVEVFGRAAHVGRAFSEGVSAVTALGELLSRIAGLADPDAGVIVNVGPLQGAPVTNAVPDYAACWGNVRFVDEEAGERLAKHLHGLATTDDDAMPRVVVHHVFNRPAKPRNESVERLALVARGAAESLGQDLPFASTGGVCDGNVLQHAGLPTIDTLGVKGGNLHRPDEWIDLGSLTDRAQLLALVLLRTRD